MAQKGWRVVDSSTRGRRNRRAGREIENEVANWIRDQGIPAERISRTGSPGDDIVVADCWSYEVKGRGSAEGFKTLMTWMKDNPGMFLRVGGKRGPVLVVLTPEHWAELVRGQRG